MTNRRKASTGSAPGTVPGALRVAAIDGTVMIDTGRDVIVIQPAEAQMLAAQLEECAVQARLGAP